MPNIVHRIGVDRIEPQKMYDAITSLKGLSSWWTEKVTGDTELEGILQFRFGEGGLDFKIVEKTLPSEKHPGKIRWKCIVGPEEWLNTEIQFQIIEEENEVILLFQHKGWKKECEFMHHCSTQWAYFLIGLKSLLEIGQGTPYGAQFKPTSQWSPKQPVI